MPALGTTVSIFSIYNQQRNENYDQIIQEIVQSEKKNSSNENLENHWIKKIDQFFQIFCFFKLTRHILQPGLVKFIKLRAVGYLDW